MMTSGPRNLSVPPAQPRNSPLNLVGRDFSLIGGGEAFDGPADSARGLTLGKGENSDATRKRVPRVTSDELKNSDK